MNKISIIGTGSVGATIAYSIAMLGMASEIVMIDINNEKALGEALDIRQGTPFCAPCSIYAGDYPDAVDSNVVILTSGIARKPGQSRLELAQINVNITKSIIPSITKYAPDATYIIVSNPVDILTYIAAQELDLARNRLGHNARHLALPRTDCEGTESARNSGQRYGARRTRRLYVPRVERGVNRGASVQGL